MDLLRTQLIATLRKLVAVLQHQLDLKRAQSSAAPKRARLLAVARFALGTDASPLDIVNDELGCAESVSTLIGKVIPFPVITGTWTLNEYLDNDNRFVRIESQPEAGDIIISPTGSGNGRIRGHVGIIGEAGIVYSNNSATGLWDDLYTLTSWNDRYFGLGGIMPRYYRIV